MSLQQISVYLLVLAVLLLGGCNGISGPGSYKTETVTVVGKIKGDLSSEGKASASSRTRLDALLAKYEPTVGDSLSFKNLKSVKGIIEMMETSPDKAAMWRDSLQAELDEVLRKLESEGQK